MYFYWWFRVQTQSQPGIIGPLSRCLLKCWHMTLYRGHTMVASLFIAGAAQGVVKSIYTDPGARQDASNTAPSCPNND